MPLLSLDDDYEDKQLSKEGKYPLRVTKVIYGRNKDDDKDMLTIYLLPEHDDGYAPFRAWLTMPDGADAEDDRGRKRDIKRFFAAFGLTKEFAGGFDPEQDAQRIVGATGECMVKLKESKLDGQMYPNLVLPKVA